MAEFTRGYVAARSGQAMTASPLDRLLDKGFDVTIPTGKVRPVALPVGVHSALKVKGRSVPVVARAGAFTVTPDMIWLGAEVDIDTRGIVSAR